MSDTISTLSLYKSEQAEKASIKVNQNLETGLNLDDSLSQCQILQLEKLTPFFIPRRRSCSNYLLWLTNQTITIDEVEALLQTGKNYKRRFHINFQLSQINSNNLSLVKKLKNQYSQTFISYEIDKVIYPQDIDIINAFDDSESEFLKASNCESGQFNIESELIDFVNTRQGIKDLFLEEQTEDFYFEFTKLRQQVDELYKKKNLNSKIAEVAQFLQDKFNKSRENMFDEGIDEKIQRVLKINDAESILNFYEFQIAQDTSNYCYYFKIGEVLYHLGKYDQAQDLLLIAISIKQLPEIYIRLAMTYFKLGNYKKLEEICEQLRKISPNNTKINIFLGLFEQAEFNYKKALSQYNNAISKSPDQIIGYYFKAKCYQEMNEYEGVKEQVIIMDVIDTQNEAYEKEREELRSQTENINCNNKEFTPNILLDLAKKALE